MNPNLDPSDERLDGEDRQVEKALRPKELEDFSGQPKIVENLKVFIAAARLREEALDHVLLHRVCFRTFSNGAERSKFGSRHVYRRRWKIRKRTSRR